MQETKKEVPRIQQIVAVMWPSFLTAGIDDPFIKVKIIKKLLQNFLEKAIPLCMIR